MSPTHGLGQGWREFRANQGLSAAVILTLALGIGGTATMFATLRALGGSTVPPGLDPALVGRVVWTTPQGSGRLPLSGEQFGQIARATTAFDTLSASVDQPLALGVAGRTVAAKLVTPDFFGTFGCPPVAGRVLSAADSRDAAVAVPAILQAVRGVPGVQAAAVGGVPGIPRDSDGGAIEFEGCADRSPQKAVISTAGAGYFDALGLPVLRGRGIEAQGPKVAPVGVIGAGHASRCWPGQDPIGRRFRLRHDSPWVTVVGVVPDTMKTGAFPDSPRNVYLGARGVLYLVLRRALAVVAIGRARRSPVPWRSLA